MAGKAIAGVIGAIIIALAGAFCGWSVCRAWGSDDLDLALVKTNTGELQRNILPHQIVFHDGERADTVRRFDSWGELRATQKR